MFDLGISKIVILAVIGLVVLGPERLPKVARVAGVLFARARGYVQSVKNEVLDEVNGSGIAEVKNLAQTVKNDVLTAEAQARQTWQATQESVRQEFHADEADYVGLGSDRLAQTGRTSPTAYEQKIISANRRTGRSHWRVKTYRVPEWYRQHNRMTRKVLTEAARMKKHRPHQAGARLVKPNFFE